MFSNFSSEIREIYEIMMKNLYLFVYKSQVLHAQYFWQAVTHYFW